MLLIPLLFCLSACQHQPTEPRTPVVAIPELPAYLRQPCEPLNPLEGGDGKSITQWFVTNIPKANACQRKHDGLLESYDAVEKLNVAKEEEKP